MNKPVSHYYGDMVRRLFVLATLVMIITLPFFAKNIEEPLAVSFAALLATGIAAGLTSPRFAWSAIINILVATGGVVIFELHAVRWYSLHENDDAFFWTNQLLSVIFLIALYYGFKTIRRAGKIRLSDGERQDEYQPFWDKPSQSDGGDA
jgi:hypothetical protein